MENHKRSIQYNEKVEICIEFLSFEQSNGKKGHNLLKFEIITEPFPQTSITRTKKRHRHCCIVWRRYQFRESNRNTEKLYGDFC